MIFKTDHRKQRGRKDFRRASQSNMIYDISDRPPFGKLLLFSIQMMLSVFTATVLIANICGMNVSAALVGAACGTFAYILITKGKSPMFISNSGAFVAPVIMAFTAAGYAGVLVGGLTTWAVYAIFAIVLGLLGADKIFTLMPQALIGAVTVVIGANLMTFIPTYLGETGQWGVIIALITALAIAIISHYAKGLVKILPFLLGTLVGYAVAVLLTLTGVCQLVDFSIFNNIKLFVMPKFAFILGKGESYHWSTFIPIIITYVAYTMSAACELLSDHMALGKIIGVDLYEEPGLHRLFLGEGLANVWSSLVGGLGACSYGEGVACVGFSKVASVWVTGGAAVLLAAMGFIGPIQAFIASIPNCVFAGTAIILYGFIANSGIKMLKNVDLDITKNQLIVSAVLSIGLGGVVLGGSTISFSGTALALLVGIALNLILKEKKDETSCNQG